MAGDWGRAELWLIGSYVGFVDQTYPEQARRFINASAETFVNDNPAPAFEVEGVEEMEVVVIPDDLEEPAKKRQAFKKAAHLQESEKQGGSSPTTRSKSATSSTPPKLPLKITLKIGGTSTTTSGQAQKPKANDKVSERKKEPEKTKTDKRKGRDAKCKKKSPAKIESSGEEGDPEQRSPYFGLTRVEPISSAGETM